jgi:putative transposase
VSENLSYTPFLKKKRHRFPGRVIEWAVRLYKSNPEFSYRDVALLLAKMGIYVTHKTVYEWVNKFGEGIPSISIQWHPKMVWSIQESIVYCNGDKKIQYSATSKKGETLMILMKARRSPTSAKRVLTEMLYQIYSKNVL